MGSSAQASLSTGDNQDVRIALFLLVFAAGCTAPQPLAPVNSPAHPHTAHPSHEHSQQGYHGHRFDDAETWSKRFDGPERDAWQKPENVQSFVKLEAGQTLADIGAGTGYFAVRFAKQPGVGKVFAIDIEPSMVNHTNERGKQEGISNMIGVLGAMDNPKIPEPVDVIFICDTYHHIDARTEYFKRLTAHIKPGGRLIIVDFKLDSPEGPPVEARLTPEQIDQELAPSGYERVATDLNSLPRQYMLSYRVSTAVPPR